MLSRIAAAPLAFVYLLAVAGGISFGMQPPVNARLRAALGDPIWAACASFIVGTIALAIMTVVLRSPAPNVAAALRGPWWIWLGGVLGAFYVAVTVIVIPRLGAAGLLTFAIFGFLLAGLTIDALGLFGVTVRVVSALRILGAALVVAGTVLITRF